MKKADVRYYMNSIKKELGSKTLNIEQLEQQKEILYGTFGYHDSEPPHSIVHRKIIEIENNDFGLWGTTIDEKGLENIREFCGNIKGDVYLFLKFTDSSGQKKDIEYEKKIWTIEDVMKKGNYFSAYQNEKNELCDLNPDKTHIIVKGSKRQNVAYMAEDYFFYDSGFTRKGLLACYEGKLYNGEEKKSGEMLFTRSPCFLLKRKEHSHLIEEKGNYCEWAIIVKLKKPYIVEMCKFEGQFATATQ